MRAEHAASSTRGPALPYPADVRTSTILASFLFTFAAGIAHELSTPLGVIAMRAEQLENSADDDRARRGARAITEQVSRIHDQARRNRMVPSPAQKLLGEKLVEANLGKYKLTSQQVIGSAILDFACNPLKVAVSIDEGGDPAEAEVGDAEVHWDEEWVHCWWHENRLITNLHHKLK